ncbi:MAG: M56 family metallopeptidase [Thermocrispum sp.]
MTVAACLLLYSLAVAVLVPPLLARLTRSGIAPRLGVTVWLIAIVSVLASWAVAAGFLGAELWRSWTQPTTLISACVATLHAVAAGDSGVLLQLGMGALTGLATLALAALAWRWGTSLLRARTRTHGHAHMARVIGRRLPGLDAVILDAPERLAYCAAGRPHTIVITSAALDALDRPHLDAVLAHEHAHLAGRHHLLLAATRGLAAVLPRITLFTAGATEIARLLEMCADDAAVRTHDRHTLLGALLTLSGAATLPAGALGAASIGLLDRAERLAGPPQPGRRARARLLLSATVALLLTGPVVTALLAAHDVAVCYPGV